MFSRLTDRILTKTLIEQKSRFGRISKRTFDLLFSLLALFFGFPVLLIIALIIKLSSPGPIFYIQHRIGRNYLPFGCIKFRTMKKDAADILSDILASSSSMRKEFELDFKLKKDPRVTNIGRFLRRSSLDELPQIINVIRGEMSIVGPRPIVYKEIPRYGKYMKEVASVRPGLTGLWQVSGRNNLSYKKRVELDVYYVRFHSFLLDLVIIIKTFGVLLLPMDRGAY